MIEEEGKKMRCLFFTRERRRVGGIAETGGIPASCSGGEEVVRLPGGSRMVALSDALVTGQQLPRRCLQNIITSLNRFLIPS